MKTNSITEQKGYDENKKTQGRKRHIVTDTIGLILAIVIHNTDIQDREGAKETIKELKYKYPRLVKILADQGYTGALKEWTLEIVAKVAGVSGFNFLPKKWIVERTFGWFAFHRRLCRDYEALTDCNKGFIHLTMIRIMLNKLENFKFKQPLIQIVI